MTITIDRCAINNQVGESLFRLYHLPNPARHGDIFKKFNLQINNIVGLPTQGFLTNTQRFVDRKEAARIAFEAGQITKLKDELFSEDLW